MFEAKRYLGIELAGAKNQKTSLAALEYYPKEGKTFLLDIFDRISPHDSQTPDEALLEIIEEMSDRVSKIGLNVPWSLPPCITCTRKNCPLPPDCTVAPVKWMREITKKAKKSEEPGTRVKDFTPYTQRPVELWLKYQVLAQLPPEFQFELDETLGGSRAPLTARMNFLRRQLEPLCLVEVVPKLTVSLLSHAFGIQKKLVSTYRNLEEGVYSREAILTELSKMNQIFIYDRDLQKLAQNLTAFDAFICAFTALLADQGLCARPPKDFPQATGWISYPHFEPSS